ncbi:MAG: Rieske 2Fe-2S domain-containing protein [Deltaproteobacteria bacterium]|nr:Rieske 2Fe-2S domain-containing protein [Deltaproteobacteria bacterium]
MDDGVEDPKRRALLRRVGGACGAALGAAVLIGPAGVAISPLVRGGDDTSAPAEPGWLRAGALASFAVGAPRRIVLRRDVRDAWLVRRDVPIGVALVERLAEGEGEGAFRVLSGTCPHLGCAVTARQDPSGFAWLCPCHDSLFARDGSLAPGRESPSPRGLDPLPWRTAGGALEVQWLRFVTGTAERRVIG